MHSGPHQKLDQKTRETDFRWVLRRETQAQHDRLDQLIGTLDLSEMASLRIFLRSHLVFFQSIKNVDGDRAIPNLITCLLADIATFDASPKPAKVEALVGLDPLAVDYIVSGSRLGNEVLKRRWMKSNDLSVLKANRYFSAEAGINPWQQVCLALSSVDCSSLRSIQITRDVRLLFNKMTAIFEEFIDEK